MSGKIAMCSKLELFIVIILFLFFMVSCSSPSRYRVLIGNEVENQIECSGYFYNRPKEIVNKGFDELFNIGKKASLEHEETIHINRPTITDYNYFWVGCRSNKGVHWVLNEKFEEYERYWFDISEGLRIDYIIYPNGEVDKSYWD